MDINFVLNVIIQVTCIFIFLSVFYFTYASTVEGQVVENQVKFLINDLLGIHLDSLPSSLQTFISNAIKSINVNTQENIDAGNKIDQTNNDIKSRVIKIACSAIVIVSIITITSFILSHKGIHFFKNLKLNKIFIETAVILIAVALTEFSFLTFLAKDYISIDPNELKAHTFTNLKDSII
jgi:hypothetical protein